MKKLKTKRLILTPMTDDELREAIASETDAHLRNAYSKMLAGCTAHPAERLWYTCWRIVLRESGGPVGGLGFKGPPENGAVEIGYGIDEAYRENGYATEAVKAAQDWAFSQENVYFVTAETTAANAASNRVLDKLGFSLAVTDDGSWRYEKERPAPSWLAVYLCLGMSVGLSIGVATDNIATGMSIGMCIGVALGVSLDAADKKKRAAFRAARAGNGIPEKDAQT